MAAANSPVGILQEVIQSSCMIIHSCFMIWSSFNDTNPLGPVLVSAAAIPDPQNVPLRAILNGNVVQNGNTSKQIFNVKKTVSFLSQSTTLLPGTIIMTGTPGKCAHI